MTELEKLERAKMYIDSLAQGENPLSGERLPEEDIVNNIRIARCLFYVSEVLGKVIDGGGRAGAKRNGRKPFYIDSEKAMKFEYSKRPVAVSEIAKRINALCDDDEMKKFSYKSITGYLISIGLLEEISLPDGKSEKRPTSQGNEIGIFVEERQGENRSYRVVVYNILAQEFIINNLESIFAFSSK